MLDIYCLVGISIPSCTIFEDDIHFYTVLGIYVPITFFGRYDFCACFACFPNPSRDGIGPSRRHFRFHCDIFGITRDNDWNVNGSPSSHHIIFCVRTIAYFSSTMVFLHITPTWTRAVFVLHGCIRSVNGNGVMRCIHLGHLLMTPTGHFTSNITSIGSCRHRHIVLQSIHRHYTNQCYKKG